MQQPMEWWLGKEIKQQLKEAYVVVDQKIIKAAYTIINKKLLVIIDLEETTRSLLQ